MTVSDLFARGERRPTAPTPRSQPTESERAALARYCTAANRRLASDDVAAHFALDYLEARFGLNRDDAVELGLGVDTGASVEDRPDCFPYSGPPRLVVPLRHADGTIQGVQARLLKEPKIGKVPRWVSAKGRGWSRHGIFTPPGADDDLVVVCEGPTDALAVAAAGLCAAAVRGASLKTPDVELAAYTEGRHVIVAGDSDTTGQAWASSIADHLHAQTLTVPDGHDDVAAWSATVGVDEFRSELTEKIGTLLDNTAPDEPAETLDETEADGDGLFRIWTPAELLAEDLTIHWHARGLLARPTYGMLAGEMKTLKSHVATFIAMHVASGQPIFDHFAVDEPAPVLFYVGEGGRIPFTRRIARIAHATNIDPAELPLHISFDTAPVTDPRFTDSLKRDLDEHQPALVLLDPFYAFHGTNSSGSSLFEEGALLTDVQQQAAHGNASLLIINHFNQTGSGDASNASSWQAAANGSTAGPSSHTCETPDVDAGHFQLLLDIGSRQWGGTQWDLNLNLGHFDPELGNHDGPITWTSTATNPTTPTPPAPTTPSSKPSPTNPGSTPRPASSRSSEATAPSSTTPGHSSSPTDSSTPHDSPPPKKTAQSAANAGHPHTNPSHPTGKVDHVAPEPIHHNTSNLSHPWEKLPSTGTRKGREGSNPSHSPYL
ncbi:MAG: helicase RepA family protein [Acidimicrobiia bacterium]|nr:helicase RepA family protein [Acidimicrobiia bacterium]